MVLFTFGLVSQKENKPRTSQIGVWELVQKRRANENETCKGPFRYVLRWSVSKTGLKTFIQLRWNWLILPTTQNHMSRRCYFSSERKYWRTRSFLISSDQEGNFVNEMFLQDAVENPKAGIRILIDKENYFETYAIGQKIKLKLLAPEELIPAFMLHLKLFILIRLPQDRRKHG